MVLILKIRCTPCSEVRAKRIVKISRFLFFHFTRRRGLTFWPIFYHMFLMLRIYSQVEVRRIEQPSRLFFTGRQRHWRTLRRRDKAQEKAREVHIEFKITAVWVPLCKYCVERIDYLIRDWINRLLLQWWNLVFRHAQQHTRSRTGYRGWNQHNKIRTRVRDGRAARACSCVRWLGPSCRHHSFHAQVTNFFLFFLSS